MSNQKGKSGMGSKKHAQSGYATKSPRFRFLQKLEAERQSVPDKSRIKNPKDSVQELFKKEKT